MRNRAIESVSWRALIVESAAIAASILLAFFIDAWWDGHKDARRESVLLGGLLSDFEASRPELEARLSLARRMARGNELLLERLGTGQAGAVLAVPDSLILAVLGGPTYEPNTNALDAAIATGDIELIRSEALRRALANWNRVLADTTEDELEVRRITNQQVVPLLSRSTDLTTHFSRLLDWATRPAGAPGDGATEWDGTSREIAASTELAGALALRSFYVRFAAEDLEQLQGLLEEIIALLDRELDRT